MATYNYKGTGITGTSTTAKIFKKSGVTKAAVNQYYFNTETGHVYKCTVAGAASTAKWQYVRTDISNSPDKEVTGLGAPSRGDGNHVMTASWKVPNNLTNAKNGRRATDLEIDWALGIAGKDPKVVKKTANESLTTHSINLNNLKIGSKTYTRASFYPYSNKPTLKYVTVKVKARNSRGSSAGVKATRNFTAPRKPSISAFSFNNETGNVSATITTNAGADYQERHDTKYKVEIYNSVTGKTTTPTDTSSTSTSVSVSGGYSGYQGLTDDQYVKVTVSAFARGYAGDSESVSKSCYISAPTKASIGELSQKSDRCAVNISMPKKEAHPITGVRLQYLANTTYAKASDIPASPGWTDYGVQDNSDCTALVIDKETIAPDAGKHSWIRVKTWNWDESVPSLVRYSDPKLVSVYESTEATAADDKITILSAIAGKNGTSIKVQLGWTNDGNTGTELSWSDEEDTWKSTEQPEDFTFTWTDGSHTSGGTTYYGSALVTIKGLEPSTKYWIHARRYLEGENSTTYSAAAIKTCVTSNTSLDADQIDETVVASCSGVVPKGESLQVYWAFSSNNIQKKWQIISTAGKVILEGEGSTATAQIPADRLEEAASGGVVNFKVYATADSEPAESNVLSARIVERPSLSITDSSAEPNYIGDEDTAPYIFRAVETTGDSEYDTLVGASVGWNQLIDHTSDAVVEANAQLQVELTDSHKIPFVAGHKILILYTQETTLTSVERNTLMYNDGSTHYQGAIANRNLDKGQYYWLFSVESTYATGRVSLWCHTPNVQCTYSDFMCFDLTAMLGTTIADYIYTLEQGTAGSGVAFFRKYFGADYYPYDSGSIRSVEGLVSHDMVGFNQWDEEWEVGGIDPATGAANVGSSEIRSKNYIKVLPNTAYYCHVGSSAGQTYNIKSRFYDADKNYIGTGGTWKYNSAFTIPSGAQYLRFAMQPEYGTTYNHDICINISDAELNGQYKPYEKHSYPLDSTVTLRGLLKLEDGKLKADGDVYKADGSVTRKYKEIDFPDTWSVNAFSDNQWFIVTTINDIVDLATNTDTSIRAISNRIIGLSGYGVLQTPRANMTMGVISSKRIFLVASKSDFASTSELVIWARNNNVKILYELATPTTDTAQPYAKSQKVEAGGTEEYVTSGIVPVGHRTKYANRSDGDFLKTNNLSLTVSVSTPCDLMVVVTSQGAVGQFPTGVERQTEGDTIYSGVISPAWTADGNDYSATIALPSGLDFWDLGRYTAAVTAIDTTTGLRSERAMISFTAGWTHKAVAPFDFVTITPIDDDDSGVRIRAVDIVLTAPTGSQQTDVYDIYRLTGDGAVLIGEGFPLSFTARDLYAPFGDRMTQHYRIALRTADGDVNFSDIEYVADADYLKIDWDGHSVDLPYSVTVGDAYEKSVTIRQHMDGSVDGYWNRNILRKGKLHTDVIKLIQQNEIDLVRQLARYPGAVFVRTPDGCAYEADVQVSDLSTKNSAVLSIALDATEIGLTDEFILPTPFEEEEEES